MSVLVGICTGSYCVFFADQRETRVDENDIRVSDGVEKIVKLNERAMIGATGYFPDPETAPAAIAKIANRIDDIEHATVDGVLSTVSVFLEENPLWRHCHKYAIAGVNADGNHCIYSIKLGENNHVVVERIIPGVNTPPIGMYVALPPSLTGQTDRVQKGVEAVIKASNGKADFISRMKRYIADITKDDPLVGGEIQHIIV